MFGTLARWYRRLSWFAVVMLLLGTLPTTTTSAQAPILPFQARGMAAVPAQSVLLSANFETGLPPNWTLSANPTWRFDNPLNRANLTGGSGRFALLDSDALGNVAVDANLITPVFNPQGASKVRLSFRSHFRAYEQTAGLIFVTANNGVSWTQIVEYKGTDHQQVRPTFEVNVPAGTTQMAFAFVYRGTYGWYWQVDDVLVEAVASIAAPSNLTAAAQGYSVNLQWRDNSSNEARFVLERSLDGTTFSQIAQPAANATAYTDANLACAKRYTYRIRATNGSLISANSNAIAATTAACQTTSTATLNEAFSANARPTNWTVRNNVGSVGWEFVSTRPNETGGSGGFAIIDSDKAGEVDVDSELRTPPLNLSAATSLRLTFNTIFQPYETSTADVDLSLDGGSTWQNLWRRTGTQFKGVVAVDLKNAVGRSNVVLRFRYYKARYDYFWQIDNVSISAWPPPAAPTGLSAQRDGNGNAMLAWQGSASGYRIERAPGNPPSAAYTQIATISNGAKNFVDSNAARDASFSYRVRAFNAGGTSGYSNVAGLAPVASGSSARVFHYTVSYYGSQPRAYVEKVFQYAADSFYEMSDGAFKLGRVEIYINGGHSNDANIIWRGGDCRANAYVAAYQYPWARLPINTCDDNIFGRGVEFDPEQQNMGYTIGHEIGHYLFSVYDEYREEGGACDPNSPSQPCDSDVGTQQSVMHNQVNAVKAEGFTVPGDLNWLNFSTSRNFSTRTAQYRMFGASAWDTLVRPKSEDPRDGVLANYPGRIILPELQAVAPAPGGTPKLDLQSDANRATARSELSVKWYQAGTQQVLLNGVPSQVSANAVTRVFVLDHSAGLANSTVLADTIDTLRTFIAELPDGDLVAVLGYAEAVTTISGLVMLNDTTRAALDTALAAVQPSSTQPNLTAALNATLSMLANAPATQQKSVYLIGSGANAAGNNPYDAVPQFQSGSINIYGFGFLASPEGDALLRSLAETTGGSYSPINTARQFSDALDLASQTTSAESDVLINYDEDLIESNTTVTWSNQVDASLESLDIEFAYLTIDAATDNPFSLVWPDQSSIELGGAPECESTSTTLASAERRLSTGKSIAQYVAERQAGGSPRDWLLSKTVQAKAAPSAAEREALMQRLASTRDQAERYTLTFCSYRFSGTDLVTGTWELVANNPDGNYFVFLAVNGTAKPNLVTFQAEAEVPTGLEVSYPEPILLKATISERLNITDGRAVAWVIKPDYSETFVEMQDDGIAPDATAGDGVYAAQIDYDLPGEYIIRSVFWQTAEDVASGRAKHTGDNQVWAPTPDAPPIPKLTPVGEIYQRMDYVTVTVLDVADDDHADWSDDPNALPTLLTLDNEPVSGAIRAKLDGDGNLVDDWDVFQVNVPDTFTGTLALRVDRLGLEMDPYAVIYSADYAWTTEAFLQFVPSGDDYLVAELPTVKPGSTFFIELTHYDDQATKGTYNISVGPILRSESPRARVVINKMYLPLLK